jgi:DNA-binding transcriptional MerR regulator
MSNDAHHGLMISEVARATGYSVSHLHRLEEAGVVTPERDDLNRRRFSERIVGQLIERRATLNRPKKRA